MTQQWKFEAFSVDYNSTTSVVSSSCAWLTIKVPENSSWAGGNEYSSSSSHASSFTFQQKNKQQYKSRTNTKNIQRNSKTLIANANKCELQQLEDEQMQYQQATGITAKAMQHTSSKHQNFLRNILSDCIVSRLCLKLKQKDDLSQRFINN